MMAGVTAEMTKPSIKAQDQGRFRRNTERKAQTVASTRHGMKASFATVRLSLFTSIRSSPNPPRIRITISETFFKAFEMSALSTVHLLRYGRFDKRMPTSSMPSIPGILTSCSTQPKPSPSTTSKFRENIGPPGSARDSVEAIHAPLNTRIRRMRVSRDSRWSLFSILTSYGILYIIRHKVLYK